MKITGRLYSVQNIVHRIEARAAIGEVNIGQHQAGLVLLNGGQRLGMGVRATSVTLWPRSVTRASRSMAMIGSSSMMSTLVLIMPAISRPAVSCSVAAWASVMPMMTAMSSMEKPSRECSRKATRERGGHALQRTIGGAGDAVRVRIGLGAVIQGYGLPHAQQGAVEAAADIVRLQPLAGFGHGFQHGDHIGVAALLAAGEARGRNGAAWAGDGQWHRKAT